LLGIRATQHDGFQLILFAGIGINVVYFNGLHINYTGKEWMHKRGEQYRLNAFTQERGGLWRLLTNK
jgi:hypothetical protein